MGVVTDVVPLEREMTLPPAGGVVDDRAKQVGHPNINPRHIVDNRAEQPRRTHVCCRCVVNDRPKQARGPDIRSGSIVNDRGEEIRGANRHYTLTTS